MLTSQVCGVPRGNATGRRGCPLPCHTMLLLRGAPARPDTTQHWQPVLHAAARENFSSSNAITHFPSSGFPCSKREAPDSCRGLQCSADPAPLCPKTRSPSEPHPTFFLLFSGKGPNPSHLESRAHSTPLCGRLSPAGLLSPRLSRTSCLGRTPRSPNIAM